MQVSKFTRSKAKGADRTTSAVSTYEKFMVQGVIYFGGLRWTYYSQSVLSGGGLSIPNRHVSNGFVCDGEGNICLASNDYPKGTILQTPFGVQGKIYDCGCASGTVDVYVQ